MAVCFSLMCPFKFLNFYNFFWRYRKNTKASFFNLLCLLSSKWILLLNSAQRRARAVYSSFYRRFLCRTISRGIHDVALFSLTLCSAVTKHAHELYGYWFLIVMLRRCIRSASCCKSSLYVVYFRGFITYKLGQLLSHFCFSAFCCWARYPRYRPWFIRSIAFNTLRIYITDTCGRLNRK